MALRLIYKQRYTETHAHTHKTKIPKFSCSLLI